MMAKNHQTAAIILVGRVLEEEIISFDGIFFIKILTWVPHLILVGAEHLT